MIAEPCRSVLQLPVSGVTLAALCVVPADARGLVLFVHGQGSNRFSGRNQHVAQHLQHAGLATVLFDLLSDRECAAPFNHHSISQDLPLLLERVVAVIDHLHQHPQLLQLPLALFGSSTGAALALSAAVERSDRVRAVVCRGGRPDLVPAALDAVTAPTLLLVGSHDLDVLELNSWAGARLRGLHELRVVPGASHLFTEPGTLDLVSEWSLQWFLQYLPL